MTSIKRHIAWQARSGSTRIRQGSKKAALTCWEDFATVKLVPVKMSFFLIMGATQCVGPFSTLFARALGLSLMEVALAHAVAPILPLFAPPLAKILADKISRFKIFLIVGIAVSGFVALLNLSIPLAREPPVNNKTVHFDLYCGRTFYLEPTVDESCTFFEKPVSVLTMRLVNCGYVCPNPVIQYPKELHDRLGNLTIPVRNGDSGNEYSCLTNADSNAGIQKCFLSNYNDTLFFTDDLTTFTLHKVKLDLQRVSSVYKSIILDDYTMSSNEQEVFDCSSNGILTTDINITSIQISGGQYSDAPQNDKFETCMFHCDLNLPRNQTCDEKSVNNEINVNLTLWLFIGLKTFLSFTTAFSYTLYEMAVAGVTKEGGFDYAFQRAYGSFGSMIVTPICGLLIDVIGNRKNHFTAFYISFVLYCLIKLACALVLLIVKFSSKLPRTFAGTGNFKMILNLPVFCLINAVFVAGLCFGFIEVFQPWILRDLSAPNWFIGTTTSISSLSAMPFLIVSSKICAKFGQVQAISFGLLCYTIRCLGYSFLTSYYWCLPLELLEGATTGLLVASALISVSQIAPKSMQSTLHSILATVHYGVGKSIGCLTGGYLMSRLGTAAAFQIFSGIPFVFAFLYYLIFKLYLLPRQEEFERHCKEVAKMPIKTVSLKDHRRNSIMYDGNTLLKKNGGGQLPVRESKWKTPDSESSSHYQYDEAEKSNLEPQKPFPDWSDEENYSQREDNRDANLYENVATQQPTSSTPSKYPALPFCNVSEITDESNQGQDTEVTQLGHYDDGY